MFDIGFIELLIISMVALIVIGPERLPKVARTVGHLIGRVRRYASSVKIDIQNEMRMDELNELQASVQKTASSIEGAVREEIDQLKSTVEIKNSTETASSTDAKLDPQANLSTAAIPPATEQTQQQTNTTKQDQT
jgi:sec-independent protein translocase protein TatB